MSSAPVLRPATRHAQRFVSQSDEAALLAVNRYHLATADQLRRVLLGSKARSYMRAKVSALAAAGYLLRSEQLRPAGPSVYSLGPRGRRYLQSLAVAVPDRLRKPVVARYGYAHLRHTLGVTDLLIAADLLAKARPDIRVAALLNEHTLARQAVRVALPTGQKVTVIPDAWLDLRYDAGQRYRFCLAIEYDRGTEWQPVWRQKVRALLAWARGPYATQFGTDSLTIAVIVAQGPQSAQRCRSLLRWTEAELGEQQATGEADLFRITACDVATIDPQTLFLAPRFAVPFATDPIALLALPQGGA